MRIMGLKWTGAAQSDIDKAVQLWVKNQQPDGGWKQLPQMEPDAYATGITLYALSQTGMPASHPVYKKGITWLLANQYADGTWFVPSRSPRIQAYFEGGSPYGHDQWISSWATGWAVMALAEAVAPPVSGMAL